MSHAPVNAAAARGALLHLRLLPRAAVPAHAPRARRAAGDAQSENRRISPARFASEGPALGGQGTTRPSHPRHDAGVRLLRHGADTGGSRTFYATSDKSASSAMMTMVKTSRPMASQFRVGGGF